MEKEKLVYTKICLLDFNLSQQFAEIGWVDSKVRSDIFVWNHAKQMRTPFTKSNKPLFNGMRQKLVMPMNKID
jgi:hypothetical protein